MLHKHQCIFCNKAFESKRINHEYCTLKCYFLHIKKKPKICMNCNNEFIGRYNSKFCSKKCNSTYKSSGSLLKCKICNKEYYIKKSKIFNSKYCSKMCRNIGLRKYKKCIICGNIINKINHSIKTCSKECLKKSILGKNNSQYKFGRTDIACKYCNKIFNVEGKERNRKFCSTKCLGLYHTGKNSPCYKQKIEKICPVCNTKFHVTPALKNRSKYCSRECEWKNYSIIYKGKNSWNWKGGLSFEPYGIEFDNKLKNKIRNNFENKCVICGNKDNYENLNIHHIDYNKLNNDKTNLIPLCRSHHLKTNSNRIYWKQYFDIMFTGGCN